MRVLPGRRAQDFAIKVVQSGKQGDGAVADTIVRAGSHVTDAQRQTWLRALQRLALALFIATQNQGPVGWIQVKTDHVPELAFELRVAGQFERPGQMRLYSVGRPDALDARGRNSDLPGHRAHTPAGSIWRRLRGLRDQFVLFALRDRSLAAPAWCILEQSVHPERRESSLPTNHRRAADTQLRGRRQLRAPRGARQHNTRPAHHSLRRGWRGNQPFQLAMLKVTYLQRFSCSRHSDQPDRPSLAYHSINETLQ